MENFTLPQNFIRLIIFLSLILSCPLYGQAPTTPASNVSFNNIDGDRMRVSWTRGNGSHRIVVVSAESPVSSIPSDGTDYIANSIFGNGNELSPGEFVVYKGTGTNVTF